MTDVWVPEVGSMAVTCASGCSGFVFVDQAAEDGSGANVGVARVWNRVLRSWRHELPGPVRPACVVVGDIPRQNCSQVALTDDE